MPQVYLFNQFIDREWTFSHEQKLPFNKQKPRAEPNILSSSFFKLCDQIILNIVDTFQAS